MQWKHATKERVYLYDQILILCCRRIFLHRRILILSRHGVVHDRILVENQFPARDLPDFPRCLLWTIHLLSPDDLFGRLLLLAVGLLLWVFCWPCCCGLPPCVRRWRSLVFYCGLFPPCSLRLLWSTMRSWGRALACGFDTAGSDFGSLLLNLLACILCRNSLYGILEFRKIFLSSSSFSFVHRSMLSPSNNSWHNPVLSYNFFFRGRITRSLPVLFFVYWAQWFISDSPVTAVQFHPSPPVSIPSGCSVDRQPHRHTMAGVWKYLVCGDIAPPLFPGTIDVAGKSLQASVWIQLVIEAAFWIYHIDLQV